MRLFRLLYGAGPGNLAVLLLAVAVAGYAASIVAGDPAWPWMAVWFVAAVVVHDGVLTPLAAVADAVVRFSLKWFPGVPARSPQEILAAHGLKPCEAQLLDRTADVSVTPWRRLVTRPRRRNRDGVGRGRSRR